MQYNKPPITIKEQIATLKKRGLTFGDENIAAHYLSNISYYRLRAYTYPFQDNKNPDHPFNKIISFEKIIELYVFDRKLRLMVFDALEKIEIALRTKIIYTYSIKHGSHWYEKPELYRNPSRYVTDLSKLYDEIGRSTETFIQHYKDKYTDPEQPPSWMSIEVISMGLLSKVFENLKKGPEKIVVSEVFGLNNVFILESWMHTFSHLRNICAHHCRLWNRRFTTAPQLPNNPKFHFLNERNLRPNKLYALLSCMLYVLKIISPKNSFASRFKALILMSDYINLKEMGFPETWTKEPLWES